MCENKAKPFRLTVSSLYHCKTSLAKNCNVHCQQALYLFLFQQESKSLSQFLPSKVRRSFKTRAEIGKEKREKRRGDKEAGTPPDEKVTNVQSPCFMVKVKYYSICRIPLHDFLLVFNACMFFVYLYSRNIWLYLSICCLHL